MGPIPWTVFSGGSQAAQTGAQAGDWGVTWLGAVIVIAALVGIPVLTALACDLVDWMVHRR